MSIAVETNKTEDKIIAISSSGLKDIDSDPLRKQAREYFLKHGIPTRKNEEYKYIGFDQVFKKEFAEISPAQPANISEQIKERFPFLSSAHVIMMVNGFFSEENSLLPSLPSGVKVVSLNTLQNKETADNPISKTNSEESDAFAALNTAVANDGVLITIEKNIKLEKPVVVFSVLKTNAVQLINPRNLFILESGAEAQIIELFASDNSQKKTFNNSMTEVRVGENATLHHYRIQQEDENSYQVNTVFVQQKAHSIYNNYTFTLSGALVRNNLQVSLDAENCESHLYGLFIPKGNELVDNHTLVDHRKPNCQSNEIYKGIISDKATGIFNGKIFVRRDAQKTNAYQSSKNILLSDDATINTKPQLEIYADDVKCSHGTSTGKVDEEALFYLQSRGLGQDSARKLLLNAFTEEVTSAIKFGELRNFIEKEITERLSI